MANMLATFNQLERRLIAQRTRRRPRSRRRAASASDARRSCRGRWFAAFSGSAPAGTLLRAIADSHNRDQVPTAQGGAQRYPATVRQVLLRTA